MRALIATLIAGSGISVAYPAAAQTRTCVDRDAQGECRQWKTTRRPKPAHGWITVSAGAGQVARGAEVLVDNEAAGNAPVRLRRAPGRYSVEVVKDGFQPFRSQVTVRRGEHASIHPALARFTSVEFQAASADARGARIRVGGADKGAVPARIRVGPGRHQVEISKRGFAPLTTEIDVAQSERLVFPVQLTRLESGSGEIVIESNVRTAEILLDDRPLRGQRPPAIVRDVSAGYHVVEVRQRGWNPWRQTVQVRGGESIRVIATLTRGRQASGAIEVRTNVAGAEVLVDGVSRGETPTTVRGVTAGAHTVTLRAAGYPDVEREVVVAPGSATPIYLEMRTSGSFVQVDGTEGAEVSIDDQPFGAVPLRSQVSPGRHRIEVRKRGHAPFTQTFYVQPGTVRRLKADLAALGELRVVTASGLKGDVFVDGARAGPTPFSRGELPPGEYVVRVEAEEHEPFSTVAVVRPGKATEVTASFGVEVVSRAEARELAFFKGRHKAISHRVKLGASGFFNFSELGHFQYEAGFKARAFDGGFGFGVLLGDRVTSTGSVAAVLWSLRVGANLASWPRADVNAWSPVNVAAGLETHLGFRTDGDENGIETSGAFAYSVGLFLANTIHMGCRFDVRGGFYIPFTASEISYPPVMFGVSLGYKSGRKGSGGCVELDREL